MTGHADAATSAVKLLIRPRDPDRAGSMTSSGQVLMKGTTASHLFGSHPKPSTTAHQHQAAKATLTVTFGGWGSGRRVGVWRVHSQPKAAAAGPQRALNRLLYASRGTIDGRAES